MKLVTVVSTKEDGPVDPRPEFQGGVNWSAEQVMENRLRILKPLGIVDNFVRVNPKHEDKVVVVNRQTYEKWQGKLVTGRPEVDALITNLPNVGLECQPADCGVYVIFHKTLNWLGLVHAGREGSIKKILEKTLRMMAQLAVIDFKEFVGDLCVMMAPAICGLHYRKKYIVVPKQDIEDWKVCVYGDYKIISEGGNCKIEAVDETIGIDFVEYNRQRLLEMGLNEQQLDISPECTFETDRLPSSHQDKLIENEQSRFMVMAMMKP